MSRIRGKNTTPELRVRSLLHRLGYRFRLHVRIPVPPSTLVLVLVLVLIHHPPSSFRPPTGRPIPPAFRDKLVLAA